MTRCLAIGCDAAPLADAPLCARHWSLTPKGLHGDIRARLKAGELCAASRLVLADDGAAVRDISPARSRP